MNCAEARRSLSAHLDGELDAATVRRVAGHLEQCGECAAVLRQMGNVDNLVAKLPATDPGETFSTRLLFLVRETESRDPSRTGWTETIMGFFGRFFELLLGARGAPRTNSLLEFGDFPPLSISHAYFQLLNRA